MGSIRFAVTFVELLVVVAIVVMLVALLLPSIRSARPAARQMECTNNLKQIALALHLYEKEHGSLPPAYTVDADGNRLHSWRTLILPYVKQSQLFESIDLNKQWDDPINAKARETVVESYQCPSSGKLAGLTNYLGVVGPHCAFTGSTPRELGEATDGLEKSIVVIEVNSDQEVPWMSPNDISEDEVLERFLNPDSETNHPGGLLAAFLDGHVSFINDVVDLDILRALLTIDGNESMPEF